MEDEVHCFGQTQHTQVSQVVTKCCNWNNVKREVTSS